MHIRKMRSRNVMLLLTAVVLALLASCTSDITIGNFMVTPSSKIVYTDTCSVKLSSMIVDSLVTTNTGVVYCGRYEDDWFGTTTATGYVCFNLNTFSSASPISTGNTYPVVFDSLMLFLNTEKRFYGDTLKDMTIHIHKLKELIEDNEDEHGECFNTTHVPYDEAPLVSHTFRARPRRTVPLEIRLPDAMGQDILQKMKDRDDVVSTAEKFRRWFKGFALVPDGNDEALLGFKGADSTFYMKMYYHTVMETKTEYTVTFPVLQRYEYNQYSFDRQHSAIKDLDLHNTEIPATETGNAAYVQGIAGMYSKIEFPYLNNLQRTGKLSAIISAELQLYPVRESVDDETPLPNGLTVYISNEEKPLIASGDAIHGVLVKDAYERKTHYSFNIRDFIGEDLDAIGVYKRHLQLVLPDTSLFRLVLGDGTNPEVLNQSKLNIEYMVYDPQE